MQRAERERRRLARVSKAAWRLRERGLTLAAIAEQLGTRSRATVYGWVQRYNRMQQSAR